MSKGATRLEDLAKLAGVSTSTVSRALSDHKSIPQALRDRIAALAQAHGYVVNQSARSLRLRKTDTIIRLIYEQALEGRIYTANQFAEGFENKEGLGSSRTIRERLSVLATKGHVKFFKNADDYGLPLLARSRQGYLCVDGMMLNTGRLIVPTHYKDPQSGEILPVLYAPGLPFSDAGETEDS